MQALSTESKSPSTTDGDVVRVAGGRPLVDAATVIAAAVLEHSVWLVTRDDRGHTLYRFHPSGMPAAAPTELGALGDGVTIAVNRIGARVALLEGDRAVLIRERDGRLAIERMGERRRDRRVLVGARGVAERTGAVLKLRTGALPPLPIPSDLRSYSIGTAAVVHDGNGLLVELVGHDMSTVLVYDLRSGDIAKRIRLGELRILAILASSAVGCAVDANGTRLVVVQTDGNVSQLGRSMNDLDVPSIECGCHGNCEPENEP